MKRIGIIGGLSNEATLYYYRTLIDLCNEDVQFAENNLFDYPEIILYCVNMKEYYPLYVQDKWPEVIEKFMPILGYLEKAGADFGIISSNTPHEVFNDLQDNSPIPLISIVEETAKAVEKRGLKKVGLFGTKMTMRLRFYHDVFKKHGIGIAVPKQDEQDYIHNKIINELVGNIISDEAHKGYIKIAQRMVDEESIEGLILGCTEIPMLLNKEVMEIPFFDTSKIHVKSALDYSRSEYRNC
ncbi:MAG: aspartate/glutamate racemase family protein [Candidatus Hodarchaeales archaeon]